MARKPDLEKRLQIARDAFAYLRKNPSNIFHITITELARELGMKRSTFYWYFSDIKSIFTLVLKDYYAELDTFLAGELAGIHHPIDLLFAHIRTVHAFNEQRAEDVLLLFNFQAAVGNSSDPSHALDVIQQRYLPRRQYAIALIEEGIRSGFVAPCDPEALITCISALTDGLILQLVIVQANLPKTHDFIWTHILEPLRLDPEQPSAAASPPSTPS